DDFDDGDDSMEDSSYDDFGPEDSLDDDSGIEDESADDLCDDEFTVEDAVMTGIAFGWGYEEGKRRKLEKKMNDDRDNRDRKDDI
ncbi:MAG: hypothetical protein JRI82_07525, partial [Deltaproteobacteria bacterium]|nr:hypothetical protein [Deltaproteobacteria bacterium]